MNLTREGIFSWIVRISCSRSRRLILGSLDLAALSGFLITRLPFQSDVLNLFPENAPENWGFRLTIRLQPLTYAPGRQSGKMRF